MNHSFKSTHLLETYLKVVSFETIYKGAITYLIIIAYLGMYYVVFCQNIDSEATKYLEPLWFGQSCFIQVSCLQYISHPCFLLSIINKKKSVALNLCIFQMRPNYANLAWCVNKLFIFLTDHSCHGKDNGLAKY